MHILPIWTLNCPNEPCSWLATEEGNQTTIPCVCPGSATPFPFLLDDTYSGCNDVSIKWFHEDDLIGQCAWGNVTIVHPDFKELVNIDEINLVIFNTSIDNGGCYRCQRDDNETVGDYKTELSVEGK